MRPKRITLAPAAADRNGIAEAQTTAGAGSLTLDGALAGAMDVPRHASVYCAADISGVTFGFTGTDRLDNAITEDVTGPTAGATVTTLKNYKTITQVAVDGAVGTNCEIGSADEMETGWITTDYNYPVGTIQVELSSGASLTYAWQTTADDMQAAGFQESNAAFTVDGNVTGETTSQRGSDTGHATASRVAVTGFSSGSLVATFMQGTT